MARGPDERRAFLTRIVHSRQVYSLLVKESGTIFQNDSDTIVLAGRV